MFRPASPRPADRASVAAVAAASSMAAIVMLAAGLHAEPLPSAAAAPVPAAAAAAADPSRFILNALLVPALDSDAVPLRWVDPRPASLCGPATQVRVNQQPLAAGALVPDAPFEVEWLADGCRPFGASGPRFDGRVRLTVVREDWGMSAVVEPSGLRIGFAGHETALTRPIGAWLPFIEDAGVPIEPTAIGAAGLIPDDKI